MINKKIGVLLLFALLVSFGAKAQRATSMRINEVLVINEDNFVDDYGKRHAWIELFNNSAGSVNIAGCYLTNDKSNPKKYPIPKAYFKLALPVVFSMVISLIYNMVDTFFIARTGNTALIAGVSTHQKKITLRYTMQTVKL